MNEATSERIATPTSSQTECARVVEENQIWDWLEDHEDTMPLHRRVIGLATLGYFILVLLVLTGLFSSVREAVVAFSAFPVFYAILLQSYRVGARLRRSKIIVHLRLTPTGVPGFERAVVRLLTSRGTLPMMLWLMMVLFAYRNLWDGHGIALIPVAVFALFPALGWAFALSGALASAGFGLALGKTFASECSSLTRRLLVQIAGVALLGIALLAASASPPLIAVVLVHHAGFFALLCVLPRNPLVARLSEEELEDPSSPAVGREAAEAGRPVGRT